MFNHHSIIPWGSFRNRQEEKWGSFQGWDHFGVNLRIISGLGIISGSGSFRGLYRPPWKTGGKSLYALVPFWSWNTLQHYLVDVMMKQKSFFVQGNLNFALMYRNNIEFSVFVLCHWVDCEIYWEYRTASHLVFWKPWPVTGHIATAKNFTRKLRYK